MSKGPATFFMNGIIPFAYEIDGGGRKRVMSAEWKFASITAGLRVSLTGQGQGYYDFATIAGFGRQYGSSESVAWAGSYFVSQILELLQ
jgi:hypothetical protein